jgi:hypothetical protein
MLELIGIEITDLLAMFKVGLDGFPLEIRGAWIEEPNSFVRLEQTHPVRFRYLGASKVPGLGKDWADRIYRKMMTNTICLGKQEIPCITGDTSNAETVDVREGNACRLTGRWRGWIALGDP